MRDFKANSLTSSTLAIRHTFFSFQVQIAYFPNFLSTFLFLQFSSSQCFSFLCVVLTPCSLNLSNRFVQKIVLCMKREPCTFRRMFAIDWPFSFQWFLFMMWIEIEWRCTANMASNATMEMHILPFAIAFMPNARFFRLVGMRMAITVDILR